MIKYICIEEFELPILNKDGNTEYIKFEKGSKWEIENDCTVFAGNTKLKNEKSFIELMNEKIDKYFIKMIDKATLFSDSDGYPEAIILPKSISESEIMEEALKCFTKYMLENEDDPDSYFLDNKYSETGIKWAMFDGDMTEVITNVKEETLYKVWQVEINQYPY